MNTDKIIDQEFLKREEYPIWYYKELEEVNVDYVVWNLLKEKFIVEIDGSKHMIIFGKNSKDEIGQAIRYDDIKNSNLCSFEVVRKGFKEGKWFIILDKDTTEEFKKDYIKRKEEHQKKQFDKIIRNILRNFINSQDSLSEEKRNLFLKQIDEDSIENIEKSIESIV